ncbi:hypothetical protein C0992_007693, partial [Termitomyces sp. T32_za158]
LAVGFWVVGGRESDLDVECFAQRGPEFGDEEGATIGDDVVQESSVVRQGKKIACFFDNVIHGDGGPGASSYWKGLQESIGPVAGNLGSETGLARLYVLSDVLLHARPEISPGDELESLAYARVAPELVVVVLPEDVEVNLSVVGGVDAAIPEKQLLVVREGEGLIRGIVRVVTPGVVLFEYCVEMFQGDNHAMVESVMLGFEGLLGIDVGSPGQGIRLGSKSSQAVVDGEIVFRADLGATGLATAELFSHGEVLEVVVVRVDLDMMPGSFEVGAPLLKGFNNGEELLVVDVIVEFCTDHRPGVEGNGA